MKIYNHGSYGKGTLIVTPANLPGGKDNSDWFDRNSGVAINYTIKFKNGMAEVDDTLGELLCSKDVKLAYEAPFLQPRAPGIAYGRRATDVPPVSAETDSAIARLQA